MIGGSDRMREQWRHGVGIPEGMVAVIVIDEPAPPVQKLREDMLPEIWNPKTATVLVPKKSGWCDKCWDVHRHEYCPEDVLEKQFQLLEKRSRDRQGERDE